MTSRVFSLFLILVVLAFAACGGKDAREVERGEAVLVKTAVVEVQPLSGSIAYSGTVEAIDRVRLSTRIMGWIDAINYKEGERVSRGATLVKLRSEDAQAKAAQAEAAIQEAEAQHARLQKDVERIEALRATNAATQKELDDVRAAFSAAQARRRSAEEMKREAEEMIAYTTLKAPFDGVLTRKFVQAGDMANPGQPIVEVENMNMVKVVASVPETDVRTLEVGEALRIQVPAARVGAGDGGFDGTIDRIVPSADPMSRKFEIHVVVDNASRRIKPGMFARVAVGGAEAVTLVVPRSAVFRRGQLEGVFAVQGDTARLRWIRTGVVRDDVVEVLSGLNEGDVVVVDAPPQLVDGEPVEALQ